MSESQLNSRDITFRTVFHDVEGIKSYLRKLRSENERVMKNIQSLVQNEVYKAFNSAATLSSMVHEAVNDIVSPLKTEWVNDDFVDYIGENISDITINLVSNNFMSIVGYNSNQFNAYINSSLTSSAVEGLISPLQTSWVNNEFMDYIADNTSDTIVNLISNRFMSIVGYNSGELNAYINNAITSNTVEAFVSQLQTEWVNDDFIDYIGNNLSDTTVNLISNRFMSIVEYNSGELNAYINSAITIGAVETLISPLKTEWVDNSFINYITGFISNSGGNIINDIQKEIADQFPEIDVKNILKDYHLIEKHFTTLTDNVTIDTSGLANPEAALERFRILAYISGDKATDTLHYTYTAGAITEDAYTLITDGATTATILSATQLNIATLTTGINYLTVNFNISNVDYINYTGGTLWYGFTDLVNPESSTDYTVMVSIDGSPNYLPLLTSAGGHFTVSSKDKLGYISGAAEAIRNQFGSGIDVVEVVPHPLLVNDSERYIVLRAITDSTKKGNWEYRVNSANIDAYSYNKTYDRSILKFSPLETPIMYANKCSETPAGTNYYIWKLDTVFANRMDIYSIDLSNFVPWTTELPNGLTTALNSTPLFNNINNNDANFGKLGIREMCRGSANLASIDLRCINSVEEIMDTNNTFTDCTNLRTVYCNESVKNYILPAISGLLTSYAWNYITDISAWVATPTPQ